MIANSAVDLFTLSDPLRNSAFRGTVGPEAYNLMVKAGKGELLPLRPILVNPSMGSRLQDIIWISLEPVVHERVVEALSTAGMKGWATYPVQVHDRTGQALPGYHGLAITGRCGSMFLNKEHSTVVYRDYPGGRFPSYKGLYVTMDSWDGSDVFVAADGNSRHLVVTQRLADLFRRKKITNVALTPVSDVQVSAMDQPRFPKARDSSAPYRSNIFLERGLNGSAQDELRVLADAGAALVQAAAEVDASNVVKRIATYVEEVRPLAGGELTHRSLAIGYLWAQQIVSVAGWIWAELHTVDEAVHCAIVSSDRSVAILPGLLFRSLLANAERPDNSVLLFNMVVAGRLPNSKPGAFLILS